MPRTPPDTTLAAGSRTVLRFRLALLFHVVLWCVAVLPPQLSARSVVAACLASVCLALIPLAGFDRRTIMLGVVHLGTSSLAALTVVTADLLDGPDVLVLMAGALVLLMGVHLLALAGAARDDRPLVVQLLRRPFVRSEEHPWPSVLRRCVLADAGILVGAAFTGIATLGGGFLTAGIAILGDTVAVGALALAALDAARFAPALLPWAEPVGEHGPSLPAKMLA